MAPTVNRSMARESDDTRRTVAQLLSAARKRAADRRRQAAEQDGKARARREREQAVARPPSTTTASTRRIHSEVTVTNSTQEEPVTRASLRGYAAVQRERYLQATRAEKRQLLDEVVAVTGIHRKAAIRLLRRQPRAPAGPSRTGRPPCYGPSPSSS